MFYIQMTEFAIERASNDAKVGAVHLGMVGLASTFHTSINEPHRVFARQFRKQQLSLDKGKIGRVLFSFAQTGVAHETNRILPTYAYTSTEHLVTAQGCHKD